MKYSIKIGVSKNTIFVRNGKFCWTLKSLKMCHNYFFIKHYTLHVKNLHGHLVPEQNSASLHEWIRGAILKNKMQVWHKVRMTSFPSCFEFFSPCILCNDRLFQRLSFIDRATSFFATSSCFRIRKRYVIPQCVEKSNSAPYLCVV